LLDKNIKTKLLRVCFHNLLGRLMTAGCGEDEKDLEIKSKEKTYLEFSI
jgi:hypothetical protein